MERRFLFIVLDPRDELWQQSPPLAIIKEPSFIFAGAMRGEVTPGTGGVKPQLAWFSRNHFLHSDATAAAWARNWAKLGSDINL